MVLQFTFVVLLVGAGCRASTPERAAPNVDALWRNPTDLEARDLFAGSDEIDAVARPNVAYQFLEDKKSGVNPGYDVTDVAGQRWCVKLGAEARTEVVVSRIVWAVGYHQPILNFVPRWTMTREGRDTSLSAARFRFESPAQDKTGEWSWRDNPFLGTRQLAGLYVLMVLFNNWDLKTGQNALYTVTREGGAVEPRYMVRDLGASLGRSAWLTFGTKDDAAGFEEQPFITGVYRNRVRFAFDGGWMEPQLLGSITPADVRWICGLLARLSDRQWSDAFRAGGYSAAEAAPFIRRLKEKVAEGRRVSG